VVEVVRRDPLHPRVLVAVAIAAFLVLWLLWQFGRG
jgi:hypothetical protein